jgi:glycosyltransferase involved in cell wall biosynthesis
MPSVLASVRQQQVAARFEVILCDDGSDDQVFEEIRRSPHVQDVDLRFVWQPRAGFRLSRSRNNAIRSSQGNVLVFADGDTWLAPDFLQQHWDAHAQGHGLVCGSRCTVVSPSPRALVVPDGELLSRLTRQPQPERVIQEKWMASDRPWMACLAGNCSVPASAGLDFDEHFESWGSEDRDFAYRAWKSGLRPYLLPESNAIHLTVQGRHWRAMTHDAIVQFLRNKRYLADKYPAGEMQFSLALVRHCHLDPRTQRWSMGRLRDVSVSDVLNEFAAWAAPCGADGCRNRA